MGLVQHHALIATTSWDERIEKAKAWIDLLEPEDREFFLISPVGVNGETSIVLFPDGSKEGWPQSEQGDVRREQFIEQVLKKDPGWMWIEGTFGERGSAITRDHNVRRVNGS